MSTPGEVRPEYEVLARDFRALAAPFGLPVDASLERDLVLVAASFEAIDRYVDATEDAGERARMCAAILTTLRGGRAEEPVRGELSVVLDSIRPRLVAFRALGDFVSQLATFFVRSETLRTTTRRGEFVLCVLDEARCAAEMALLVIPDRPRFPRFVRFFRVLSEIANLVDKLHDVRGDWQRGEIGARPDVALHVRLLASLAFRLPALLFLARRPFRLIAWGARYALPPPRPRVQPACYPPHPR
jgi:hypothetical protein